MDPVVHTGDNSCAIRTKRNVNDGFPNSKRGDLLPCVRVPSLDGGVKSNRNQLLAVTGERHSLNVVVMTFQRCDYIPRLHILDFDGIVAAG